MTGGAELRAPDATRQRYDQHGRLVSFQAEPYVHPRDLDERQLLNEPVDIRKTKAQFIEDSLGTEREFVNRRAGLSVPGQLGAADQGFDEIATNPALAAIAARRGADVAADIAVPYYDAITGADERSVAGTVGLAAFDTATLIPVFGQYARGTRVARAGAQGLRLEEREPDLQSLRRRARRHGLHDASVRRRSRGCGRGHPPARPSSGSGHSARARGGTRYVALTS